MSSHAVLSQFGGFYGDPQHRELQLPLASVKTEKHASHGLYLLSAFYLQQGHQRSAGDLLRSALRAEQLRTSPRTGSGRPSSEAALGVEFPITRSRLAAAIPILDNRVVNGGARDGGSVASTRWPADFHFPRSRRMIHPNRHPGDSPARSAKEWQPAPRPAHSRSLVDITASPCFPDDAFRLANARGTA